VTLFGRLVRQQALIQFGDADIKPVSICRRFQVPRCLQKFAALGQAVFLADDEIGIVMRGLGFLDADQVAEGARQLLRVRPATLHPVTHQCHRLNLTAGLRPPPHLEVGDVLREFEVVNRGQVHVEGTPTVVGDAAVILRGGFHPPKAGDLLAPQFAARDDGFARPAVGDVQRGAAAPRHQADAGLPLTDDQVGDGDIFAANPVVAAVGVAGGDALGAPLRDADGCIQLPQQVGGGRADGTRRTSHDHLVLELAQPGVLVVEAVHAVVEGGGDGRLCQQMVAIPEHRLPTPVEEEATAFRRHHILDGAVNVEGVLLLLVGRAALAHPIVGGVGQRGFARLQGVTDDGVGEERADPHLGITHLVQQGGGGERGRDDDFLQQQVDDLVGAFVFLHFQPGLRVVKEQARPRGFDLDRAFPILVDLRLDALNPACPVGYGVCHR